MHDRHSRAGAARTLVTVLAGLIHLLMLFFGCAFVYPIDANTDIHDSYLSISGTRHAGWTSYISAGDISFDISFLNL